MRGRKKEEEREFHEIERGGERERRGEREKKFILQKISAFLYLGMRGRKRGRMGVSCPDKWYISAPKQRFLSYFS
jgi:hypothetical protein